MFYFSILIKMVYEFGKCCFVYLFFFCICKICFIYRFIERIIIFWFWFWVNEKWRYYLFRGIVIKYYSEMLFFKGNVRYIKVLFSWFYDFVFVVVYIEICFISILYFVWFVN